MPKQGEIDYLKNIGVEGAHHAVNKPFSDPFCGGYLLEIGAIMTLLPQPPAKLLDLGCGTGWTSCFFAKRGYQVTGQDIAPDMIHHARSNQQQQHLDNLHFVVCDYESLGFEQEFDCAVFFDALHHSIDEVQALAMVYRALKPGGICITSEPGEGHATSPASLSAMEQYGVTERDMPPWKVIQAGKQVGFRSAKVYPHAYSFQVTYQSAIARRFPKQVLNLPLCRSLYLAYLSLVGKRASGIVVLTK